MVGHRQLPDSESGCDRERWDERLEQIHWPQRRPHLLPHDAKLAAGVMDAVRQDGAPDGVGRARSEPAPPGILPVDAPPADKVERA